jgi:D-serine deaminase-like pyridoxal phosphate-dependent protein
MVNPSYAPKVGDAIASLDTPSMIVDLDLMEANIKKLFDQLLPTGVNIRPHLKTTKSAILAQKLAAAGAKGGCVAKLSEAEVICAKGFTDVLITCEIVGPVKVRRLVELFRKHRSIRIVVDSEQGARAINEELEKSGIGEAITTLIDLDVGLHRTGVQPGEPALNLAQFLRVECKWLRLIGVQGYEGHLQHVHGTEQRKKMCFESMSILTKTVDALRKEGHQIDVVTTGGTGTAEFCVTVPGITEVQPGSFLFMDTDYRNAVGSFYSNSLTILSTVISKQGPKTITIDAGLKSLTTDSGLAECKTLGYTYGVMGDEHGSLSWTDGPDLKIGDKVEMIPSHIDPTINLHNMYYAYRGGVIEEIWPVDSRGMVQ